MMKKKEEFINEADIRNVLTYSDVLFLLDFTTDFHNVYTVCNIAPRIAKSIKIKKKLKCKKSEIKRAQELLDFLVIELSK